MWNKSNNSNKILKYNVFRLSLGWSILNIVKKSLLESIDIMFAFKKKERKKK